ncbi:hypothetical protein DFAR_2770033 [Desulfarculales bacterium]
MASGDAVRQAIFRWRRADLTDWEGTEVTTKRQFLDLSDGVRVKWVSGQGLNLLRGDGRSILAGHNQGPALLLERDHDTIWQASGCVNESLVVDLGAARPVAALRLADHNLSDQALVPLQAVD